MTLTTLRRALGFALDDIGVYTVTASTTNTITSAGFQDQNTTNPSSNALDGRWIYIATGVAVGNQRRVKAGGLVPSTGTLTPHLGYGTAPTVGSEIELTGLFPAVEQVEPSDTSYRTIINRALAKLVIPDRITLTITTAESYSLATYPWLDRPELLLAVLEAGPTGGRAVDAGWRGFRLIQNAGTATLEVDAAFASAGGTLTLDVLRPANSLVNSAESITGLTADTDTVDVTVDDALPTMLAEAYSVLMGRSPGRNGSGWDAKWKTQIALARASRYYDRSLEVEAPPAAATEAA